MYSIIVGGGDLGRALAREFLANGHEVLIIEKEAAKCEQLKDELGSVSLCSIGSEIAALTKAGIERADIFIAVTPEDDDNLAACEIAKRKFNVHRVIAKVNNPKNEHIFAKLGIDCTVNGVGPVLENIKMLTDIFPLVHLFNFKEKQLELVLVKVPDSPLAGTSLKDSELPIGAMIILLIRQGEKSEIPTPETILQAGDELVCLIPSGSAKSLQAALAN